MLLVEVKSGRESVKEMKLQTFRPLSFRREGEPINRECETVQLKFRQDRVKNMTLQFRMKNERIKTREDTEENSRKDR